MKALVPVKNEINSLYNHQVTVDQGTQTFEIESEQNVYFDPKLHYIKQQCPTFIFNCNENLCKKSFRT